MLTSQKHSEIIKALKWCADRKVGVLCKTPREWAEFMGIPVRSTNELNFAALNVAAAGRELNDSMGYDWIGDNFPYFPRQEKYRVYSKANSKPGYPTTLNTFFNIA